MQARTGFAAVLFAVGLAGCGSQPVFWDDVASPLTLCGSGERTTFEIEWQDAGRKLRLTSEPSQPQLQFRGASMTDEFYSGDGYDMEIQLGGVITLSTPDGSVLSECVSDRPD